MATSVSGKMSRRSGRVWRSAKRKIAPSIAAMTARAEVRNIGEKSATATLVAGRDPLKIITPMRPLPDPALVRSICPAFLDWELKGQGWREQRQWNTIPIICMDEITHTVEIEVARG